jgi:hypothetical protein
LSSVDPLRDETGRERKSRLEVACLGHVDSFSTSGILDSRDPGCSCLLVGFSLLEVLFSFDGLN